MIDALILVVALALVGVLILVHEIGHFIAARRVGVQVLGFSIGFGHKLFSWKRGETEYSLRAIPFGGYVKMAGEQRTDQASQPGEYLSKPVGARAAIVFAGPLVNYVVALASLWLMCVTGYPDPLPIVGKVREGMPAEAAGLQAGDRILAVDGRPIRSWEEMTRLIYTSQGRPLSFRIQRQEDVQVLVITPKRTVVTDIFGRPKTISIVGIEAGDELQIYRIGPLAAITRTFELQNEFLEQNFVGLWLVATGQLSVRESLGGPIAIVFLTSEAVRHGWSTTLRFVGFISLCLAVFNLLPIPILDGGHLLFLALEKLRGRPVSLRLQERSTQVGFALLIALALLVCINDVQRYGFVEKVSGWFRR